MVCQCGCLSVGLVADVTCVRLVMCMDYMMLVQTGVFCEPLVTANHLADVWPLSCKITTRQRFRITFTRACQTSFATSTQQGLAFLP